MDRDSYIRSAYQKATGETGEDLAPDDEAYVVLLNQGNDFIEDWQNAVDKDGEEIDWNSLWGRQTLGSTVSATDSFTVDRDVVRKLSTEDYGFKIRLSDGRKKYFTVVKPNELSKGGNRVALIGDKITFAEPFDATDPFIGASIIFAYFGYAAKMTTGSSKVPVDDPMWLVFRGAAELARNDFIKTNQGQFLLNSADERMQKMISANRKTTADNTVVHGGVQMPGYQ